MKKYLLFFACCFFLQFSFGQTAVAVSTDEASVQAAVEDYVEALYQADSTRIIRSVHPSLRKIGYWFDQKNKVYHDNLEMTYEELISLSASWNANGKRANASSIKEISILEVNDKTAIAKLHAVWGIDYFQLAKTGGKWYIMNVIWQSF